MTERKRIEAVTGGVWGELGELAGGQILIHSEVPKHQHQVKQKSMNCWLQVQKSKTAQARHREQQESRKISWIAGAREKPVAPQNPSSCCLTPSSSQPACCLRALHQHPAGGATAEGRCSPRPAASPFCTWNHPDACVPPSQLLPHLGPHADLSRASQPRLGGKRSDGRHQHFPALLLPTLSIPHRPALPTQI